MSTYYKLVCDETKLRCDAATVTSGVGHLGNSEECLRPFIVAHLRKTLRVVYEHEDDCYSDKFRDWSPKLNSLWKRLCCPRAGDFVNHPEFSLCLHENLCSYTEECLDCGAAKDQQ